ncbi:MAG TPA: hypothetical protein VIR60_01000 [Gammaproteobacteria bacterium]
MVRFKSVLSGAVSYLPGGNAWLQRRLDSRPAGTANPRYCYSVWMRHLVRANQAGALDGVPSVVAELGPGRSLGTGLAALLSGAERYIALEFVDHVADGRNVEIFDALVEMFRKQEPIPDSVEFPQIVTPLPSYEFPEKILTQERLAVSLAPERVARIRDSLRDSSGAGIIKYAVPWYGANVIERDTVDMLLSMSVMEHIDDLDTTYAAAWSWLKRGGVMSHEIDFKCHGHASLWNGHWGYSDGVWKIVRGNRPYLINRLPHSGHRDFLTRHGFESIVDQGTTSTGGLRRSMLAKRFRDLTDDDLETSNAYMLSRKVAR